MNQKIVMYLVFTFIFGVVLLNGLAWAEDDGEDDDELGYVEDEDGEWLEKYGKDPYTESAHKGWFGEHNEEYDHEAFLGSDEAQETEYLDEEEAKNVLLETLDHVDTDHDGLITKPELIKWLKRVREREINETVQQEWQLIGLDDTQIGWETYKNYTWPDDEWKPEREKNRTIKEQNREIKRWDKVDDNKDGKLTMAQFGIFLHPEESDITRGLIAQELLEDGDKNKDESLDQEEYINLLHGKKEPDFLQREIDIKRFNEVDLNQDGKLEVAEIEHWIFDDWGMRTEAEHLISQADENADGKLNYQEVLNNYELFIGHRSSNHDEL